jgi:hypothetical protein
VLRSTQVELQAAQLQTQQTLGSVSEEVRETTRNVQALLRIVNTRQDSLEGLRAGQAQQARVLDYLLRKEQERQNGDQG